MNNKDVFISYKAEEIEEASWVRSVLENNGISCWMAPACIPGGSSYAVEIPQAIRQAKVFVLILSSKAQSSQWVSREVDLAINEGKIVLPFMLENCALKDDFNFYLTNVQRYTAYENKVAAVEKMLKEIKALVGDKPSEVKQEEPAVQTTSQAAPEVAPQIMQQTIVYTQKFDGKSVWSLVLGIFAIMTAGVLLIPELVALLLSILSLDSIKKKNTLGKGLALTGQILGLITLLGALSGMFLGVGLVIAIIIDTVSLIIFIKKYKVLKKITNNC